jgi:hypothetical protein
VLLVAAGVLLRSAFADYRARPVLVNRDVHAPASVRGTTGQRHTRATPATRNFWLAVSRRWRPAPMTGSSPRCDREGTGTASLIGGRVTQLKRGGRRRRQVSGHRRQPDPDLCWNCGERGAALGVVGSLKTCPECDVTWVPGWSAARGDPDYVCWMGKAVLCVDFTKPESLGAPALKAAIMAGGRGCPTYWWGSPG